MDGAASWRIQDCDYRASGRSVKRGLLVANQEPSTVSERSPTAVLDQTALLSQTSASELEACVGNWTPDGKQIGGSRRNRPDTPGVGFADVCREHRNGWVRCC